jgi:hypothetical protein
MECKVPYFRHFIEEIIDRIKNLSCFKMVEKIGKDEALSFLQETIDMNFSRRDNAFIYKKMSEIHANNGAWEEARKCLEKGLLLDEKLPGIKKLKERIQVCR